MALEILFDVYGAPYGQTNDPQNAGIFTYSVDNILYVWDTETRAVIKTGPVAQQYTGGYVGAPEPPATYSRPATLLVDAYQVPSAGPGADATATGKRREVYHNGSGGVTFTDSATCDLTLTNLVGRAPIGAATTGSVEFTVSTSAATVSATAYTLAGISRGVALVNVAKGRLAIASLPPDTYAIQVSDSAGCFVGLNREITVVVPATPPAVVRGCMDSEARNYNSMANESDGSCLFTPRFVGLWALGGIPVSVAPTSLAGFVTAEIYAGFVTGHPLNAGNPERLVATVRATVSPRTGVATLDIAPYLRAEVGALQSDGTRRLDLNSPGAFSADLYTGFSVFVAGQRQARGYALNSAATEAELAGVAMGAPLTPFGALLPRWAAYPFPVATLATAGRFGQVTQQAATYSGTLRPVFRPAPCHGLPVAWLTPAGGWGHWVFAGRPQYADEIGEAQYYTEAGTYEKRAASMGPSYRAIEASAGPFAGRDLVEGLRTLRRSVQAWYKPGAEWVAITKPTGNFPAYREGVTKYDFVIKFTEARPVAVQGQ